MALRQAFLPEQDPDPVHNSTAPLQARFPIQEFSFNRQLVVGGIDPGTVGEAVGRNDDGTIVGLFDGD